MLSAEQYLVQLQELDVKINQDMERLMEMRVDVSHPNGIDYSKDRVQSSGGDCGLEDMVIRYTRMSERINREIDQFFDAKEQIIKEIRSLHDVNYIQVLYKMYVQYKSVKVIASEMDISQRSVWTIQREALEQFSAMYGELEYLT